MNNFETGVCVGYLLNRGKSANLGTKSITQNGSYNASDDNLDGYNLVNVNVDESGEIARLRQQLQECESKCNEIREYLYYVINDKPYDPEDPDPPLIGDTVPEIEGAIDDVLEKGYDEGYDDAGGDPSTKPIRIKPVHRQGSDGNYYTYTIEIVDGSNNKYTGGQLCPYLGYYNMVLQPYTEVDAGGHYPEWYNNLIFKITINGVPYYSAYNFPNAYESGMYIVDYWIESNMLYVSWYHPRDGRVETQGWPLIV